MRRPRRIDPQTSDIRSEMALMGVDPVGIGIMEGKSRHHLIRFDDVDLRAALIIKQNMLSLGGEAALCREAAGLKIRTTPVLLMGTSKQMRDLVLKLADQPFQLSEFSSSLNKLLMDVDIGTKFVVGERDLLSGGAKPVMGILNVTEDSFCDGGRYSCLEAAVARGVEMAGQGADIIDVGGESTRPGSLQVSLEEELDRVIPVIRGLAAEGVREISVDTTKSEVAERAIKEGAGIVNDISGMTFDPRMMTVAAESGASVILMHTRGRPETMQNDLHYDDLMGEVCSFLEDAMDNALAAGIALERICVDPGIGFGKSPMQNAELIARIGEIKSLGVAVMAGASRKSFIGVLTGAGVDQRMPGSVGAAVAAVVRGADIVRVHDVAETVQAMSVVRSVRGAAC